MAVSAEVFPGSGAGSQRDGHPWLSTWQLEKQQLLTTWFCSAAVKWPGAFWQPEVFSLCDELPPGLFPCGWHWPLRWVVSANAIPLGEKKICFDFEAEIVILFLENRPINPPYAAQTLCNVCIKMGWGDFCQKRMIFVIHLSESWEMLFYLHIECLIFTLPASWPRSLLR